MGHNIKIYDIPAVCEIERRGETVYVAFSADKAGSFVVSGVLSIEDARKVRDTLTRAIEVIEVDDDSEGE